MYVSPSTSQKESRRSRKLRSSSAEDSSCAETTLTTMGTATKMTIMYAPALPAEGVQHPMWMLNQLRATCSRKLRYHDVAPRPKPMEILALVWKLSEKCRPMAWSHAPSCFFARGSVGFSIPEMDEIMPFLKRNSLRLYSMLLTHTNTMLEMISMEMRRRKSRMGNVCPATCSGTCPAMRASVGMRKSSTPPMRERKGTQSDCAAWSLRKSLRVRCRSLSSRNMSPAATTTWRSVDAVRLSQRKWYAMAGRRMNPAKLSAARRPSRAFQRRILSPTRMEVRLEPIQRCQVATMVGLAVECMMGV
mmetsp:Transcript_2972/g.10272  ORF Transcript_2972/g.10272 Transcript_2972/m.10272 type:complete len:304 (+) Transcript_2972:220-1131(+)